MSDDPREILCTKGTFKIVIPIPENFHTYADILSRMGHCAIVDYKCPIVYPEYLLLHLKYDINDGVIPNKAF